MLQALTVPYCSSNPLLKTLFHNFHFQVSSRLCIDLLVPLVQSVDHLIIAVEDVAA